MTIDFESDLQFNHAMRASASAATRDPQGALVDSYPLSPIQAGMLFHAVGRPVPGVDIEQVVIALAEHVEEACFMAAWERVIARHGILRSRFRWLGLDQPVQDVMDHVGLPLHAHDWRGSVAAENEQRFAALLAEDRNRGFDLNRAPLMRLTLARFADAEYRVLWTFHHALLDGRSFVTVLHEVFTLYEAALRGETAVLPAPHPYREYIDWLQGIDHDSAREHWCAALAGFRAPTPLVVARHGEALPASGVYLGNHAVALAPDLTAALDVRAGEAAVTLNNLVQAAWALLLGRYSGESDVVFGATRACRKSAMGGADDRVGLFINTLPLRVAIDPGAELGPWLRALRAQQIALRDYEHTPLARVQAWSEVPGGTPLFETLVVYEHQTLQAQLRTLGGRWATRAVEYYGQTNFPLTVAAYGGDRLLLQLQYSRVRFDDSTTERMLGHLTTLLESMAQCPLNARLRDLAMVSAAERRALLSTPNAGRVFPRRLTLHEHFEQQVGRTPDSIALVCEGERLTYDALNRRANRVAHALKKVGVERGTLVGLRVERNIDMVAGILGILKCGAAYLPLDPAYPQARVEFMLRDSGASIVLTQQALAADIEGIGVTRILLDVPLEELPETNPGTRSAPDDLAYVIYTSGSTGTPKGVEITHYNVTRLFDATRDWYRFAENDVWTLFHSYAFDFSVWELWGALLHGGRVVVVPYWVSRSPEAFRELLIRERVTVLNQTPSAFRQLIRADRFVPDGAYDLRYVIFGGEALELQALRPWFERHGDARPQLVNMYGITETTVHVTYRPIGWRDIESGAGSVIGQALPDLQLYLLAPGGEPVPIGVAGEIHVGGAGVARGYRNRPDLTAERFITDSRSTGSRLYRTGDLARRLENGDIEYLGRIDDQVKIRGFRIELGEIEARIAQHPQVREACVIAREDAPGDRRLVAYVVARDAVPDLAGPLREWLRVSIPDYMVPAHFVRLDALPLTENGKVDRKALPRPDAVTPAARRHVAPRNAIERAIADIWSAVLRVPQVGVDDNFFELGGDSILSIQVIARCRAAGLNINSRDLFERPTIAQLAASAQQAVARAIDQEPAHGALPLTPIQRWFVEADFAQRDYWNQAFLFEVPPDLDLDALEAAFHELIVHHDALRLCLRHEGAEWTLEYAPVPHAERSIARFDLAGLDPDARNAVLEAHCVQAQRGLDLAEGRLVQAAHFALGAGARGRLLIVVHHLAVDGVSWRLLREDLELAYFSLKEGKRPAFPTRTSSFQRWAQRLNQYANSAAVRQSLDFWLEEGRKPVATIPQDDSSAANLERDARIVARRLNCGETDALLQQAPRAYRNHINDLLLTALAIALRRTNGGAAFRIDLEGHGREELFEDVDVARTVGWFTTVYPVRLELGHAPGVGEVLKSIKEQLRRIPDRGLSYGLLRYCADSASRDALAALMPSELLFNYLGQFDQVTAGSRLFRFAHESPGPWRSPHARRSHLLEVLCWVREGELEVRWIHQPRVHRTEMIDRLAQAHIDSLREIVSHCSSAASGGRTVSDFPLARTTQEALDRLWKRYPGFEDLYTVSPLQRLYLVMDKSDARIGLEPWHFRIDGEVNPAQLRAAIDRVVQRHPVLRSAFITDGTEPLQLVLPQVAVPWTEHDWRALTAAQRDACLAEAKRTEEATAFDIECAPLLRTTLCRTGETTWHLLWTTHHLCIDGWSWPLVFREISAAYEALQEGREPMLEPPVAYRDYIAWLRDRAPQSESYWRNRLAGYATPTPVRMGNEPAPAAGGAPCELYARLAESHTSQLRSLARGRHVTMNTLVQAAWALLLAHYSGSPDVVFGAALSGRPAEVPGIDRLVGPCVNNLPVRVRVPGRQPLGTWLTELDAVQREMHEHQYVPPEKIQAWSEVPWRYRLFDSLLVFQNYSVDDAVRRLGANACLEPVSTPESTNYPLTLAVTPAAALGIRLIGQPGAWSVAALQRYADDLLCVLAAMADHPDADVSAIQAVLPASRHGAATLDRAPASRTSAAPYQAPSSDMERTVAGLWQELLGVDRVSLDDNFFDLGGHSLLLIQAHRRLCEILERELPVVLLLQYPTVRMLARHVHGGADPHVAARGAAERARKQREALRRRLTSGAR